MRVHYMLIYFAAHTDYLVKDDELPLLFTHAIIDAASFHLIRRAAPLYHAPGCFPPPLSCFCRFCYATYSDMLISKCRLMSKKHTILTEIAGVYAF